MERLEKLAVTAQQEAENNRAFEDQCNMAPKTTNKGWSTS